MPEQIYLDNNSTTQVDPRVVAAMLPYFTENYGNPATSEHNFGWTANDAVETARSQIASALASHPREVYFTSGATEANNLAILGYSRKFTGKHIITSAIEHDSVLEPIRHLGLHGFRVTVLDVDRFGMIDLDELRDSITDDTILCSLMMGNNEIGTVYPIQQVSDICQDRGVTLHVDATQSLGKIPIDVTKMGIDLLSCSGHKLHGPKGVGAIFVQRRGRRGKPLPLIFGGGQEQALRPGTVNVPGIVGFGRAVELAHREMIDHPNELKTKSERLFEGIKQRLPDIQLIGHPIQRLPNNISIAVAGVEADAIIANARGIAISAGSACSSHSAKSSHVLAALHLPDDTTNSVVRMGVSRFTEDHELDRATEIYANAVKSVQNANGIHN